MFTQQFSLDPGNLSTSVTSQNQQDIPPTSRKRPDRCTSPGEQWETEWRGNSGRGEKGPVLLAALKWFREVVFHKAGYRVHYVLKSRIFEDGVLIMGKKGRSRRKKSRRSRCPSFALSRRHENASRYSNRRSSTAVGIGICEMAVSHES